jgi:hypothetical protein
MCGYLGLGWCFGCALAKGGAPGDAPGVDNLDVVKVQPHLFEEHHHPALQPGVGLTGAFVVTLPGSTHDPERIMLEKLRQHFDIMARRTETQLFWFAWQRQFNPSSPAPPSLKKFIPSGLSFINVLWYAYAFL